MGSELLNKKILILTITFIILLCISPINASDNNTDSMQEINDETIVMESDSVHEISTNANSGNFTELSDLIQNKQVGETVYLNKSYQFDDKSDINYTSGIELNSIIIEGNNQVIDGNGQSRIFRIVGNTVINNLKLINAFHEKGGAIHCIGNLTLNNVTFENNNAKEGAALFLGISYDEGAGDDIKIIINDGLFRDSTNLQGSLIYAVTLQTDVKINNTIFKNISSIKPIIYCLDSNLTILNTEFEDLHSDSAGGAIGYWSEATLQKSINIYNSTFLNTTSFRNGGAIFNCGSNLIINQTRFINCSSDYGGAITQLDYSLQIMNCNFTGNHALYSGGAIYTSNVIKTDISDSTFTNNRLNYTQDSILSNGGAIYADLNNVNFNNIKFINNTRNAIYCYDCKSNITCCVFENNCEAIHLAFSQLDKTDGNIYNNDTIILNDNYYNLIMTGSGIKLELINSTIDVTALPTRFDSREWGWVTPVKNQGESGACWAFSSCAALESALLKSTGVEYSLSINNMQKTMLKYSKYGSDIMFEGGYSTSGAIYALSWFGVFSQEYDSFLATNGKITTPLIAPETIHIQDAIMLHPLEGEEGRNNLKELIMKCGAVVTSMLADVDIGMGYFNNLTNAYYYFGTERLTNHAVTVVGWDDNYPASNFNRTPPGDGAWIIKNSDGTEEYDNGYIYISYYDTAFSNSYQVGYLFENTENYTKNYQTDVGGEIMFWTGGNFTYKNNYKSIGKDLISAVGTYFHEKNQNYVIEIYVNNVLKLTQTGSSPFFGFHTIKLKDEILINPGDDFTIVMKTNSVPLLTDSRTHHEPNTSLVDDGNGWEDLSEENLTASLKVYTKDLPSPKATKITASNVTIVYNNEGYLIVNLKDKDDNPIEGVKIGISLNGIKYLITNANGQVKLSVKSLLPKIYAVKITFSGNDFYIGSSTNAKVVVKKATPKLTAAKKTFKKSLKVKKYTVTLKNNKNKAMKNVKIILKVKKKTYKVKTNSKGKAKFKITNLKKKGTFKVVVKYLGSKYYCAQTVKQKIIVK